MTRQRLEGVAQRPILNKYFHRVPGVSIRREDGGPEEGVT